MNQPAQQEDRETEQKKQAAPEMPQEILVGMGRRLDAQAAVVGALEDQVLLYDGQDEAGQPGEPVGTVRSGLMCLFPQDTAVRRRVFPLPQLALVQTDRAS